MTPKEHLAEIIADTAIEIRKKYQKGQLEHGGNLRNKPGMLKMLEQEILDQVTYEHTLRSQLNDVLMLMNTRNYIAAKALLKDVLGKPTD
jgi:hypothetical protein